MKKHWESRRLIDVCDEIFAGGDVSKVNFSKEKTSNFSIPIFSNGEKNKGLYGYTNVARVKVPSITISARGTIGYSEIRNEAFYPAIRLIVVIPKKNILNLRFLQYVLQTIDFSHSGTSIPQLTVPMVREYEIPLPPLPEQQRIVALLDEAFADLATLHANSERNLLNAREMFEAAQRELFEGVGSEKTEVKLLGEVATFRNGINFTKASKGEKVKLVGVKDFQNYFWVPMDSLESVTINGRLNETDYLRKGDILAVRSNGNQQLIGRSILAGDVIEKVTHSGFTIRIRFETEDIFPEYLCHYLKSEKARKKLISGGAGISIKSLNQTTLSELPVSLPPLAEQRAIVARLDALAAETQRLEQLYQSKLAAVEELRKSVLQQAFQGEV